MNDAARQGLIEIVARHGRAVTDDAKRCEALLRDYCGQCKREINVLVGALRERVASDLLNSSTVVPSEVLLARLTRRLEDDLGLSEESSKWAVESWALALGVTVASPAANGSGKQASTRSISNKAAYSTDPNDPFVQDESTAGASSQPEEILRQALRIVFADEVATDYEKADLRRIRQRLGITVDDASRIFAEVKAEREQANEKVQAAATSPSTTLIVSRAGGAAYRSIGEAIKSAKPGTEILVRPGLYKESLVIDKAIRISGDGPVDDIVVESVGAPCLVTRAAQVEVRGLALRSFVTPERNDYSAIDISYGRIVIEACDVTTDAGACVSIHGPGASPTIRGCRIRDGGNYGIWIWDGAGGVIEDCEIAGCSGAGLIISGDTMEEAREMAALILADLSGDGSITARPSKSIPPNSAAGTGAPGLPLVRRCSIFGCRDHGIWVHYKGRGVIEHCRIFENAASGAWIDQNSDAALRHCRINHNGWEAIRVTGNSSAIVEDCDLKENGRGGLAVERGCQVRQSGNNA
jgi:hypothetical protein